MPVVPPNPPVQPPQPTPPKAAAQSGAANAQQQQAALNRLLQKYKAALNSGDATTISSLARQIASASKALGQHVTLPKASGNGGGAKAAASDSGEHSGAAETVSNTGGVNVKA